MSEKPSGPCLVERHAARASWRRVVSLALAVAAIVTGLDPLGAQQLLDRIVARVNGQFVTLTDLRVAVALGVIDALADVDELEATELLVERHLILTEVERFMPPEPNVAAVVEETAILVSRVGSRLAVMMASTGIDDVGIRDIARDNLRIRAYLDQRFGTTEQLTEGEVARYYQIHPDEFTRDGTLMPFTQAEPLARQRAGSERRASIVTQWTSDLRARSDVAVMFPTPPPVVPPQR